MNPSAPGARLINVLQRGWKRAFSIALFISLSPVAFAQTERAAWRRFTIDNTSRGADGVKLGDINRDGLPDIAVPFEQGNEVKVFINPGAQRAAQAWPSVTVGRRVPSPEDAIFVDLDRDGALDVVSASDAGRRITIHWNPREPSQLLDERAWRSEILPASRRSFRWMQVVAGDFNRDGRTDLAAGGRTAGATVALFLAPANARDLAAWTYIAVSPVGWTMSLVALDADADGDLDLLLSDRLYYVSGGRRQFDLQGVRWLENPSASETSWENHRIYHSRGGEGETMFANLTDFDADGQPDVLIAKRRPDQMPRLARNLARFGEWRVSILALPLSAVGMGVDIKAGDIDGDRRLDLVLSFSAAGGTRSGIVWLRNAGTPRAPRWERHELSGDEGVKFDNIELIDLDGDGRLDVLTTEQTENLGVVWYRNPTNRAAR